MIIDKINRNPNGNVVPFQPVGEEVVYDPTKVPGRKFGSVPFGGHLKPAATPTPPPMEMMQKTADPIKKIEDIRKVCDHLKAKKRYRDLMLFVVGINFGLRIGDLIHLKFHHLINDDLTFKSSFKLLEQKTKTTRNNQKLRYISINNAVKDAVTLYIENAPYPLDLNDFLFRSESPNKKGSSPNRVDGGGFETGKAPLTTVSVNRILKKIAKECNLDVKVSTHTLRKTFGYHQMLMDNNDPRKLMLLSKMYGHSSIYYTLMYIGLTKEEMDIAYQSLNLGGDDYASVQEKEATEQETAYLGKVSFFG